MLNTQNAIVAVDLSKTDKKVLNYAKYMAEVLKIKELNLIHIIPSFLAPGNADLKLHEIFEPGFSFKEKIRKKILETAQPIFKDEINLDIEIFEGDPLKELMTRADDLDSAFVIVGRKEESEHSGITARRIARKFYGNVLFVPEQAEPKIQRIIVPIDFSDNSARALKAALQLAENIKNASVRAAYVIQNVPDDYYLNLKIRSELSTHLLVNAETSWISFLKQHELKSEEVPIDFIQNNQPNVARQLNENFEKQRADLVVVGAQGHSAFEKFVYGSVTERLIGYCKKRPMLIVR